MPCKVEVLYLLLLGLLLGRMHRVLVQLIGDHRVPHQTLNQVAVAKVRLCLPRSLPRIVLRGVMISGGTVAMTVTMV